MNLPDAAAQQRMILIELGQTNSADFAFLVQQYWEQFASYAQTNSRLPYLYTFRAAVQARISQLAEQMVDWTGPGGESEKLSQIIANLKALVADDSPFGAELKAILATAGAAGGVQTGELTKQAPLEPCPGFPDPNSRVFRGDPVVRQPIR